LENQTILDSRLIERFEVHRDFTRLFLDAFVLINNRHHILKFNSAFCQIAELRAIDVRRINLFDEILDTRIPGNEKTAVAELLSSQTPTRIDDVPALNLINQKKLNLIMSSYPYYDEDNTLLGACLLLRDVTAESNLQTKYKDKAIESITDPLTGLYTRRYFEVHIEKEIQKAKLEKSSPAIGIIMFDLDKFKNINDTYGHQAGDFVLSETAKVLKSTSRRSDILGRYGGEELLVIIFGTSERTTAIVAEKFRSEIQNHQYVFEGKTIPVTTSVGVTFIKDPEDSKEDAIKRADSCLYEAKNAGRNIVFVDFGFKKILATEYITSYVG
jgi:diguanylate cyclase (GGDEF)-like protein